MLIHGSLGNSPIEVETTRIYGEAFWNAFFDGSFEAETQGLIRGFVNQGATFLDLSAATGSMTLLVASLGANVVAYEPRLDVFRVLEANVARNSHKFSGTIELKNVAVSNFSGAIETVPNGDSIILSPIVFAGGHAERSRVEVVDLASEIVLSSDRPLVVKIDVKGAEYQMLSDKRVVSHLPESQATVVLAVHPGLRRLNSSTYGRKRSPLTRIAWRLGNLFDDARLFSALRPLNPRIRGIGGLVRNFSGPILTQFNVHAYVVGPE